MTTRWRKRFLRRLRLYWIGIGAIVAGTVLMCAGGYRIARSPEFLAAWRIRGVDAVYYDKRIDGPEQDYYREQIARLRSGCAWALAGFALLMGGVVVARYVQRTPVRVHRTRELPSLFEGVANRSDQRPGSKE